MTTTSTKSKPTPRTKTKTQTMRMRSGDVGCWCWRWWRIQSTILILLLLCGTASPVTGASNTAGCDWTGSGLSTSRANREVISIYLRCTAGRIVWNFPRGAIRVLLSKPAHLQDNFRACLKIYPIANVAKPRARIYLEAPHRLIGLFGGTAAEATDDWEMRMGGQKQPHDGEVLVKCFRSVNGQVALYVEAEENPFANMQTVFKYNLEFINNKHYSLRPTNDDVDAPPPSATTPPSSTARLLSRRNRIDGDDNGGGNDANFNDINSDDERPTAVLQQKRQRYRQQFYDDDDEDHVAEKSSWWSPKLRSIWRRWSGIATSANPTTTTESNVVEPLQPPHRLQSQQQQSSRQRFAIDEQIIGRLGETIEICRPCTDFESAHAFCSSEIVTRGTMFGVQQRPRLATNEIYVNRTRLLRNNLFDIWSDGQPLNTMTTQSPATTTIVPTATTTLHSSVTSQPQNYRRRRRRRSSAATAAETAVIGALLSFHTPLHCDTAHEPGEFVFMGRRRFEEMMVICAPRLNEWARIVERLQSSGDAPCELSS